MTYMSQVECALFEWAANKYSVEREREDHYGFLWFSPLLLAIMQGCQLFAKNDVADNKTEICAQNFPFKCLNNVSNFIIVIVRKLFFNLKDFYDVLFLADG
jgi:hypothetical protein